MTNDSGLRDPRLVGALVALSLDATVAAVAALLVLASVSAATGLALVGAAGLVVAPLLGWRYGRRAVSGAGDGWEGEAVRILLVVGAAVVVGFVVVQTIAVPVQDGIGGRLAFIAYVAVLGMVVVAALTFLVAVPMGLVWKRVMRVAASWLSSH